MLGSIPAMRYALLYPIAIPLETARPVIESTRYNKPHVPPHKRRKSPVPCGVTTPLEIPDNKAHE